MIAIEVDVVDERDARTLTFAEAIDVERVGTANGNAVLRVVASDAQALWAMMVVYAGGDEDEASELMNDAVAL